MKPYIKLADTRKLTHEEWLEYRKRGIGGSDAAAVLGLNPYTSAYAVYHEKLSLAEPFEGNDKTRLGSDLEEYVAKRFTEIMSERGTPLKVHRLNAILRSRDHPFIKDDFPKLQGDNLEYCAICSYVPDFEATEMVRKTFQNVFCFYPTSAKTEPLSLYRTIGLKRRHCESENRYGNG